MFSPSLLDLGGLPSFSVAKYRGGGEFSVYPPLSFLPLQNREPHTMPGCVGLNEEIPSEEPGVPPASSLGSTFFLRTKVIKEAKLGPQQKGKFGEMFYIVIVLLFI